MNELESQGETVSLVRKRLLLSVDTLLGMKTDCYQRELWAGVEKMSRDCFGAPPKHHIILERGKNFFSVNFVPTNDQERMFIVVV